MLKKEKTSQIQLVALGLNWVCSIDIAVYHLATVFRTRCCYEEQISLAKQQAACAVGGVVVQTGAGPFCTLNRAENYKVRQGALLRA